MKKELTAIEQQIHALETVKEVMQIVGATTEGEMLSMVTSRFNDKLHAIPLSDWCKDKNFNYKIVFKKLLRHGYIDEYNCVTNTGFGLLQEVIKGSTVPVGDCVLINTNATLNYKRTLMVIPSSSKFDNLLLVIGKSNGSYKGSKEHTAKSICKAMRKSCTDYKIVE